MKILVLHGPNLNLLGLREPEIYGPRTLEQLNDEIRDRGMLLGVDALCHQSNSEGALVDIIQNVGSQVDGILFNPGAYTHTSIAIRDALLAIKTPCVEAHMSNVYAREEFRHKSTIADIVVGRIVGFGPASYFFGLDALVHWLNRS